MYFPKRFMKPKYLLLIVLWLCIIGLFQYVSTINITPVPKKWIPSGEIIVWWSGVTSVKEALKDIYASTKENSGTTQSETWTITSKQIAGTLPYSLRNIYYGSGYTISWNTVYGDPKMIRVSSEWKIYVWYEPWMTAKNWKEIVAPEWWWLDKDIIARRFYYYGVGIPDDMKKPVDEDVQIRYKIMYNLIHNTNQDDVDVKQWKECLTEIWRAFTYPNIQKTSFLSLCKYPVPENKIFESEKDITFVRYGFSLAYKANLEKDIKVCDKISEASFRQPTYASQFSLGEYYLVCRGLVETWGKSILDYVYWLTLISGIDNQCELYDNDTTIRKICESISDTLK